MNAQRDRRDFYCNVIFRGNETPTSACGGGIWGQGLAGAGRIEAGLEIAGTVSFGAGVLLGFTYASVARNDALLPFTRSAKRRTLMPGANHDATHQRNSERLGEGVIEIPPSA